MKKYNLVALVSLLGGLTAHAQDKKEVVESPLLAPEVVSIEDANFLSVADASKLFKSFGAKKVDASTFMLVGTIHKDCKDKVEITSTDSMGKEGFAGGWKIKDLGGAQACVDSHTASCTPSTCKSLSELAPKFTIVDINVEGMSKEQLKALPDQKIGLFRYDYAQDMSAPEYVQADPLSGVTFTSLAHLAVLEEAAAEERKAKDIEENESKVADCLAKGEGYDDAKASVKKLIALGKYTAEDAKKKRAELDNAEFEADIAKAATIALTDRKDLLKKYERYAQTRSKDADKIADARIHIARRIVSGTEKTEEDEVIGLVRADFIEANDILAKAGKAKGLSKEKSKEISNEITANNEKRAVTLAQKGEMSNSDMLAAQRQYMAIENKACTPQEKMQIAQLRRQNQMQMSGMNGYGNSGYGNQFGMGMGLQFNAGLNTGFNSGYNNMYLPQQQQRNNQYNSQACWNAYQGEQSFMYLKSQSDQTKYQLLQAANGQQNAQNPNMVGNFQQVRPNLYTTNPSMYAQNTGMWNTNQNYNSNVYNPNYYNTSGQYDQYGNRRW